jgi:signal peptidase I
MIKAEAKVEAKMRKKLGKDLGKDLSKRFKLPKISINEGGVGFASALCVVILFKIFVFDFMVVEGRSMEPLVRNGSIAAVFRLAYGLRLPVNNAKPDDYLLRWALPQPGDIVVFVTPEGRQAVKQCAWVRRESPEALFYALGANPAFSYDSRSYGPLPVSAILGKVLRLHE